MTTPLPHSARERLAARARRTALIRRRVLVATLAAFALAWGVIAFGGSMGTSTTTASVSSSDGTASTSANAKSSHDTPSSSFGDSSAAVTTAQS